MQSHNMENLNQWPEGIGVTIDRKDAVAFVDYLTDDGVFRFGYAESVKGRAAVRASVDAFFNMFGSSRHWVVDCWRDRDSVIWQGEVRYSRLDGLAVTVNFANIFRMNGEKIKEYLIYIDNTPQFA